MTRLEVYKLIDSERVRQATKWSAPGHWGSGDCSSGGITNIVKVAVLTEEVGEVARAVLDRKPGNLRDELIQVAAVAVAWLEGMPSLPSDESAPADTGAGGEA
jgi:hypothetical protein